MSNFAPDMYDLIRAGCQRSARQLAPLINDFVGAKTVVDVGGGEGWFASEFASLGAKATVYEAGSFGEMAPNVEFVEVDLEREAFPRRKFSLALCLEVAEHLSDERAPAFVKELCKAAPVVAFSAAIPGQGGHKHINEQWPQYWADLFYDHGYVASEDLRWEIWEDDEIEHWYRQNLLIFAKHQFFDERSMSFTKYPVPVVHPTLWAAFRPGR